MSVESCPKPFLPILEDGSSTFRRLNSQIVKKNHTSFVVAQSRLIALAKEQHSAFVPIVEPHRRGTYWAIVYATLQLERLGYTDEPVLVIPSDIVVSDDFFDNIKKIQLSKDEFQIGLVGIPPKYPTTDFGYFSLDGQGVVDVYIEKPKKAVASQYMKDGLLWNSGAFVFYPHLFIRWLKNCLSSATHEWIFRRYAKLPQIDFADILQNDTAIKKMGIKFLGSWLDIGTWDRVMTVMDQKKVKLDHDLNVTTINHTNNKVMVSGIENALIVITDNGVLIEQSKIR